MPRKRQTWVLLVLSLLLKAGASQAYVSSGGDWDLIKSVHGEIGATMNGSDYQLTHSMGEPVISLGYLATAGTTTLGGYLSQIPSVSTASTAMTDSDGSSTTVTIGDIIYGIKPEDSMLLTFNNEMTSTTLPGAIKVTAILDSQGITTSADQAYALIYSATEQVAYVSLAAGWAKGTLFRLTISTDAQEINGVPFVRLSTVNFSIFRDFNAQNVVLSPADPLTKVDIPAGTFDVDYAVVVSTGIDNAAIRTANETMATTLGAGRKPLKTAQIDAYGAAMQKWTANLYANASIIIPYDDANDDGRVDYTSPAIRARTLGMWRLDESAKLWVRQPLGYPDQANKRVVLPANHFSIYASVGSIDNDVSLSYAFPVPFRPNASNPDRYGTWADGIRFTNLPSEGNIRVFTISGELVRELEVLDNPQRWDLKNRAGEVVSSGVYLWEVTSGKNRKTGKLMVIK
ncbi:MAG: T9SS type A sorting domain-containing protein [Elusimicrobia bacterium]|nr:T9SS type A sorting domain-containing protein [Elusimicrobiota bacterium]